MGIGEDVDRVSNAVGILAWAGVGIGLLLEGHPEAFPVTTTFAGYDFYDYHLSTPYQGSDREHEEQYR